MKNIGIFLAYAPEQPITNQGIGRLIAFILSGILEGQNTKITIAMPAWYKETMIPFLKDQEIDPERVEMLTTKGIPYLLKVRSLLQNIKNGKLTSKFRKKTVAWRFIEFLYKRIFKICMRWAGTTSAFFFLLGCIVLLLVSVSFLPLLLIFGMFLAVHFVLKKFGLFRKALPYIKFYLAGSPLKLLKNQKFPHKVYGEIRDRELRKLVKLINKRTDISTWFVPSLFWPEIKNIKAKKVVAAPDVVFIEFPTLFTEGLWDLTFDKIDHTLQVGDHFICYSEHVKQTHLVKPFGIAPDKISVIEHGVIELNKFFKNKVSWRNEAIEILRGYQNTNLKYNAYLHNFNFSTTRFIFYSSQIRPHKNFMNLIKAFEILLREKFINCKLILTADLDNADQNILNYIKEKRLYRDILWLPDIPSSVLAALNHLAICAVNPTLFEGGFPFTFSEAYSVGTPSVMSNIAAVTALIDNADIRKTMLFDPYNVNDMVEKIEWAVKNREKLFELQAPLYHNFKKRTWKIVAQEYIQLLKNISKEHEMVQC